MNYTQLAADLHISRVLTGLWQVADMERDGNALDLDEAARAMAPYVEAGFTTFDMADHYGSAEKIAGIFKKKYAPDKDVQLLTKWVPEPGKLIREDVSEAVQRSLDHLKVEAIDLFQFHAWNYADPSWLDGLYWLQELRQEGLIRHLGLTNFDTDHLRIVVNSGIDIVSNQVCYSLLDQRARNAMTELCLDHNIKILAFGTIAGGFLTEHWLGQPEPDIEDLSTWSQMKYKRYINVSGRWEVFQNLLQVLDEIARKKECSIANIASGYILEQPAVGGVILGARLGESEHIEENKKLFDFSLDEESQAAIEAALARLSPIPGDCGDEYRRPPFLTASGDLSHHLEEFPPPYPVKTDSNGRRRVLSGTHWEELAGYCRAVRVGDHIHVSGTTATHGIRIIGGEDPAAQAHFVIDKIEGALQSLDSRLEDVVRTRVFVNDIKDWEAVARAHGARFGHIQPANTLVQAKLVGEGYLVEIEVEAVVGEKG